MKKVVSVILAVLLLASLGTAAFAAGTRETYEQMGFTLSYPEEFETMKGAVEPFPFGRIMDGLYYMTLVYYGMPKEDYLRLAETDPEEITDEEFQTAMEAQGALLYVFAIDGGRGVSDIIELAEMEGAAETDFTEVGRAEDVTFYLYDDPQTTEEYTARLTPDFAEEFSTLREKLGKAMKNAEYFVPVVPGEGLVGKTLSFETTDLDGNTVKSEDLFAQHELTMVNIWTTWCGPCKGELAGLGEMNRRLAEKDAAVIGICLDADEERELCRSLLEENGADYVNLLPFEDAQEKLEVSSFPTSYFVDREGKVLALPFSGAPSEMSAYEAVIDSLLKGENVDVGETAPAEVSEANTCRVIVSDTEGNTVEGAMVQFCSDEACVLGKTDAQGVAEFEVEEGMTYTVHILKVPAGYEKSDEEFAVQDVNSPVSVILRKAG